MGACVFCVNWFPHLQIDILVISSRGRFCFFEILLHRGGFFDFCRGRVVVLVYHALGIFACRAYGLQPLEADLVISWLALLIEVDFSIFAVVDWPLWSCILVASSRGRFGYF